MEFFVPKASPEAAEGIYEQLAQLCQQPVPNADRRIYEIDWVHDGERWTATVGEHLRGRRTRTRRSKGKSVEVTTRLSDSATVLAIFAGNPCWVVTDARPLRTVVSAWANPFMAGEPKAVGYFDVPT